MTFIISKEYCEQPYDNPRSVNNWRTNRVITVASTTKFLRENLFRECLVETIYLPNSIEIIMDNAFKDCKNLKNIVLPESLKYIGANVFSGCKSLEKIIIPPNVSEISHMAFENCEKLSKIVVSSKIENVGDYVFNNISENYIVEVEDASEWLFRDYRCEIISHETYEKYYFKAQEEVMTVFGRSQLQ